MENADPDGPHPGELTRPDLLLRAASQKASSLFKRNLADLEITVPQHGVLAALAAKPALGQSAIGRELGHDRATTGEIVRRLTARQLVEPVPGKPVGAHAAFRLTGQGRRVLEQSREPLERTLEQLLAPLPHPDRQMLVELLVKLNDPPMRSGAASIAPSGDDARGTSLEQRATFRFSRLASLSTRPVARAFQRRFGLTVAGWRALVTIGSLEPTHPGEVAKRMSIGPDKVTRAVDVLVNKRLVRRENDPADGRRSVLSLTRRGDATYREIDRIRRAVEQEMLAVLAPNERSAFHRYMDRIDAHGRRIFADPSHWAGLLQEGTSVEPMRAPGQPRYRVSRTGSASRPRT